MARLPPRRPVVDALGRHDLDPEAREPDIGEPGRGQQADRGDAQILENLGAKPDLAPLPRARACGMACVGTPAAPSRRKTMTPRPSCLKRCNEESIEFPPPNTSRMMSAR